MRQLIIRGDLQSHSGYSTAARDYCRVLAGFFDRLVGVDIHHAAERPFELFPYPLVSEAEARRLAGEADFALALSFTTPDYYVRYHGAVNVGLTFWETDRLPRACAGRRAWAGFANQMDALWAPSTHTQEVFERADVVIPIRIVPWPISVPEEAREGLPDGTLYDLDREPWFGKTLLGLARFREERFGWSRWLARHAGPAAARALLRQLQTPAAGIPRPRENALLCVAQDVPRKGLPVLLSEWMEFKRQAEARPWRLILKTSSIDPATPPVDLVAHFWEHVQSLKRQLHVPRSGVYLWTGDLSQADFRRLLDNTLGVISASLGEGFCGPAAYALASRKPLIGPRHTAIADYLIEDYPYSFATRGVQIGFARDPLRVYHPASTWHLTEPYALAGALTRLAIDTPKRRAEACARAYKHFHDYCSPERVRFLLGRELRRLQESQSLSNAA
jgi:glycosyltransferase involved in cell wall biosynthesis